MSSFLSWLGLTLLRAALHYLADLVVAPIVTLAASVA
jgi:hypothetical protein